MKITPCDEQRKFQGKLASIFFHVDHKHMALSSRLLSAAALTWLSQRRLPRWSRLGRTEEPREGVVVAEAAPGGRGGGVPVRISLRRSAQHVENIARWVANPETKQKIP